MARLSSQVGIVTGAGQGIGRAIALRLGREGATVLVNDLLEASAQATARAIVSQGGRAVAVQGDVSVSADVDRLFATAIGEFGAVDILVNNAGVLNRSTLEELTDADWQRVIWVILRGTFLCSRAAARAMIPRGRGRIVSISSGRAFAGATEAPHYAAAKAGVIAFSKSLALELAPHQINVNVVAPGIVDTAQPRSMLSEAEYDRAVRAVPWGRIGQPEDVAGAVAFLCSEDSAFMTGATLLVNGGSLMV